MVAGEEDGRDDEGRVDEAAGHGEEAGRREDGRLLFHAEEAGSSTTAARRQCEPEAEQGEGEGYRGGDLAVVAAQEGEGEGYRGGDLAVSAQKEEGEGGDLVVHGYREGYPPQQDVLFFRKSE